MALWRPAPGRLVAWRLVAGASIAMGVLGQVALAAPHGPGSASNPPAQRPGDDASGSERASPDRASPDRASSNGAPSGRAVVGPLRVDAAARLERYPTDLEFLLAVDGLADQRGTPAGLAAERFLSIIGAFDRTGDAWLELSTALRMDPREAVDALLGQHATLALRTDANGTRHIALRSTVRRDVRDRMSSAFKPSPRGLVRGIPVLSLGKGSLEMAAVPSDVRDRDGAESAEIILAPRGSGPLFEDMLRALREPPPDHALDLAWASLRSLGPSPIALLLREKREPDVPQEFFALTARPTDAGWSADFVATRSMLDAGTGMLSADRVASAQLPHDMPLGDRWSHTPRVMGVVHPEALARTMRDGALLFMSGPVETPTSDVPSESASGAELDVAREARDRMPITAAMGRFGFSDAIWSNLDGVAFVSVHAASASPTSSGAASVDPGIVMCVAFPVNDVGSFATLADAWGLSFAKGEANQRESVAGGFDAQGMGLDSGSEASSIPTNAVRAIEIHPSQVLTPSQGAGPVGARGAIAWTFATAAGQEESSSSRRGWWIVCAQTGDVRAEDVVARAQSLARDASSPGDASGDIVFRFMSRPAMMRQVTGARASAKATGANAATLGAALANRVRHEASGALDTLDRVETVIRRRPTFNELFDGTISIQMRPTP